MTGVLPLPRWILAVHFVQITFALIVLGLDAYGIRWISYNALIFSLVTVSASPAITLNRQSDYFTAILTMGICAYVISATLYLQKLYNGYVVLALHILMIIFWITDLGLVANLARIWSDPDYSYTYYYDSYYGYDYYKRDLTKREETTTVEAYKGALIAGALFAGVQFVLWIVSTVFVIIYLNKHRSGTAAHAAPPAYFGGQHPIPTENKYAQQGQAQTPYQQPVQPQQPYPTTHTPQPGQYGQQPGYAQQPQPGYGQPQQQPYAPPV